MTRRGLLAPAVVVAGALAGAPAAANATIVFSDDFNRANNSTVGNNWVEANPGGGDVTINGNLLDVLSNNGGDSGASFVTQATSNFAAPWNNVLTNNPGLVTWTVNMSADNADLSGFDAAEEGIATVLAATSADLNAASGYAVVWGQATATDPIRLVRFAGGLDADANLTPILTANSGTPADPNLNFMSVKVTYDPATDTFSLSARSDGASAFADPTTGAAYTAFGSATDTTHTSATITNVGLLGRYDGNNDDRFFDNFAVDVVPEPASLGVLGVAALGLLARRARRPRAVARDRR